MTAPHDKQSQADIQASIVRAVAGDVSGTTDGGWGDREWVHLFVDFELDHDSGRSSSISFALARRPGASLEKIAFRLSPETKQAFADLADAVHTPGRQSWSAVQVRVEADGRYNFEFSYAPPYRLGGKLNDTRFSDYLDAWRQGVDGARSAAPEGKDVAARSKRGWWRTLFGQ
ncbi:hypothetical protein [Iodidimonas sp. SYSU 1G8]|uniref:hypothetical protein n=1 Tax=Iodidimonas sp. SYSU 1G8 TaxID=3133967 RepID=UPI0031FF3EF9